MDPTEGADQPMTDSTVRYTLVFNGEIYNHRQLRAGLELAGARFRTTSDTEVILEGFKIWGPDVIRKLEGMFALVIWDRQEKTAWIARDPLGIKPLYMARKNGFIGFSSEARPLRRMVGTEVDPDSLGEIFTLRFTTRRRSNFKHIEMIPGGTLIQLRLSTMEMRESVYDDLKETFKPEQMDKTQALERVETAVVDSIRRHLQSDVGYTVQLSGGVDSSLVTAIAAQQSARPLKTFGVHLEDAKHDEGRYRDMVIERYQVDHHEILMTGKDFADGLPETCRHLEAPVAHMGTVFLKALAREIGKTDKVTLVGEGADEFFAGYDRYSKISRTKKGSIAAALMPEAFARVHPRLKNLLRYKDLDPALIAMAFFDHREALSLFPDFHVDVELSSELESIRSLENRLAYADQIGYMGSLLLRQDKIGMAHSVEIRTPFAHMPLARAINSIPSSLRIQDGKTKPLLKEVAEKWLPRELLYRRKVGLTLPIFEWMRDDRALRPHVVAIMEPSSRLAAFSDRNKLQAFVENFLSGNSVPGTEKIMPTLMVTEQWLRTLEDEPGPLREDPEPLRFVA